MNVKSWLGVEDIPVSVAERLISCFGGTIGIIGLILLLQGFGAGQSCLIGSMGASAVLLFAVPHSPLSQPWPLIGGHTISALAGVICARWVEPPLLASGLAVGLAIGTMHLGRCIHPPGGATALTAVIGGQAVMQWGYGYVLFPVLASAVLLVLLATVINAPFSWRRYPSLLATRPKTAIPRPAASPTHEQILAAMREIDTFVDISEEDLVRLVELLSPDGGHGKHRGA